MPKKAAGSRTDTKLLGRKAGCSGCSAATTGSLDHVGSSHITTVDLFKYMAHVRQVANICHTCNT